MRRESAATLQKRIKRKELITAGELSSVLQVPPRWLRDAVAARRRIAVKGPSGQSYYPAFYAGPRYSRRALEKVSKQLRGLLDSLKDYFFTRISYFLGKISLDTLAERRLADVLKAAAANAELKRRGKTAAIKSSALVDEIGTRHHNQH